MARTRPTTARRRRTRRAAQATDGSAVLLLDLLGVALVVLGPVLWIALRSEGSCGFLGEYVVPAIRDVVGVGACVIPFLSVLIGVVLIVGPDRIVLRTVGTGSLLLFLTAITWASLSATTQLPLGEHSAGGGYIGDALAKVLQAIFGARISYWVLGGCAVIAAIILIDTPPASIIERARAAWGAWREAARERALVSKEARAKDRLARPKEAEAVAESRRRTLARIFSKPEAERASVSDGGAVPAAQTSARRVAFPSDAARAVEAGIEPTEGDLTEQSEYRLPPTTLLVAPPPAPPRVESELKENIETIERTLQEFKVEAAVQEIAHGPSFSRYEIRLAPGIKVNKIVGLADNLAMQLAAIDVRVEAPIPGKSAIGVEVPNRKRGVVVLREVVESGVFRDSPSKLAFALGKDVAGQPITADLAQMPHMLIGGATNSGKSVCLNSLIASLLFRVTPEELKFVLIDPKRVELSMFDGIPHLACPVVKDVKLAAGVLRAAVQEMEHRYELFARTGVRNIDGYNERTADGERMPYMVIVVDELADLMVQMAAEVEGSITRLAQLARATGIHLVIATQRPSVDVITGVIKANISSRIAFAVSSHHDSRTILDQKGAERLIGRGDMLFLPIDASKPTRIQGCYISEKEIGELCSFVKAQRKPVYTIQPGQVPGGAGGGEADDALADEFYEPSVRFVVNTGYCSTSMLQRRFKVGYTRAARMVDAMESQGIVGPLDGAKPRQVLVTKADLDAIFAGQIGMKLPEQEDDEEWIEEPPSAEEIDVHEEEEE